MKSRVTAQIMTLQPRDLPQEWIAAWKRWCDESPSLSNAFLSYEFVATSSRVLPGVRVAAISVDGAPAAVFPFQFPSLAHAAMGWAQPCAFGLSDCFGLVASSRFSIQSDQLLRITGLNYLYFDHLEEGQAAFGLSGELRRPGLLIRLAGGPVQYWSELAVRDKEFVQDTHRRERQLASRVGPLAFTVGDASSADELDSLIVSKRRQYQATGVRDALSPEWARRLLRLLIKEDSPQCRPMLVSLYAGSTWVASHFGLRFRDRLHYWFPVYNPDLRRYAPGRLLIKSIIDRSEQLGITVIDRGEGDSTAKSDFANDSRSYYLGCYHRSNLPALAIRVFQALSWRFSSSRELEARGRTEPPDRWIHRVPRK